MALKISGALYASAGMFAILAAVGAQAAPVELNEQTVTLIGGAQIVEYLGQTSLEVGVAQEGAPFGFGAAILNGVGLLNGIIEYDVSFDETRTFAGMNFRAQGPNDFEEFYLRAHQSGNPDATQYMPRYNGVPSWQLYYGPQYSVPTEFEFGEWMRVKLAISGDRMDVYLKDMEKPALSVDLKRDAAPGGIGFWGFNLGGTAWFSNIDVTPMASVELVGVPVPEEAATAGTAMAWQISDPFDYRVLDGVTTLENAMQGNNFQPLLAEETGMVNLSRLHGVSEGKDTVFARLTINSQSETIKKFSFGFSDEAKVYLNGQLLFEGSDILASRDYRFLGTVGYWDAVYLSLDEGDNELLIAIKEDVADQTGWAVQGKFDDLEGISFE